MTGGSPPLTERPCPVCSSTDDSRVHAEARVDAQRLNEFAFSSRKLPEYMHHRLVECPRCDAVYATPVPVTPDGLAAAYESAAFDSKVEARFASHTYGKLLERLAPTLPSREGALDIGTGDGAFLEVLLAQGFSGVEGVEPSRAPRESAKPDIRSLIREGAFVARAEDQERFSLVTCFQTLEHLYEPMALARDAWNLLRVGGAFLVVCHNRRALPARLLGTASPIYDIEHLQLFSEASLRALFVGAGFSKVQIEPVWNSYPLHYWLKLLPLPGGVKTGLLRWMQEHRVGRLPLKVPAGNMVGVGYK